MKTELSNATATNDGTENRLIPTRHEIPSRGKCAIRLAECMSSTSVTSLNCIWGKKSKWTQKGLASLIWSRLLLP
jgi:hypothetical protein